VARQPLVLAHRTRLECAGYPLLFRMQRVMTAAVGIPRSPRLKRELPQHVEPAMPLRPTDLPDWWASKYLEANGLMGCGLVRK